MKSIKKWSSLFILALASNFVTPRHLCEKNLFLRERVTSGLTCAGAGVGAGVRGRRESANTHIPRSSLHTHSCRYTTASSQSSKRLDKRVILSL